MKKNLLIAGGGTGGHIAPALATGAEAGEWFNVHYACTPGRWTAGCTPEPAARCM
jgi:UDP-N-acetylglucosamine:LPS N-acetylglucosamine transferase